MQSPSSASVENVREPNGEILSQVKGYVELINQRHAFVVSTFKERMGAINQISKANEEIAKGNVVQARAAEDCENLSNSFQHKFEALYEVSQNLAGHAQQTAQIGQSGGEKVNSLISGSEKSREAFGSIVDMVFQLSQSVANIDSIIGIIIRIARQTNLLSINATIEAARAGVAGKAFSVVAGEIKKLATDTQAAGEDISSIIGGITKEIYAVQETAKKTQDVFAEQDAAITDSSTALSEIQDALNGLITSQNSMQEIIEGLFLQKDELFGSISNITQITEKSAAISQTVSSISMEQASKNSMILDMMQMQNKEIADIKELTKDIVGTDIKERNITIGFLSLEEEEYFYQIEKAAVSAGERLAINIVCKRPKRFDVDEQLALFNELVDADVDGIILIPSDASRLIAPINSGVKRGIKILCVDTDVPTSTRHAYITSDSFDGGKLAGEAAIRHLKGRGRAIVFLCMADLDVIQERYAGFEAAIAKCKDVQIVKKLEQSNSDLNAARKTLERLIESEDFDLLFLVNSEVGELAADIWKKRRVNKKLVVLSTSKTITQGVREGWVSSQIVQRNKLWGEMAVFMINRMLMGEPVQSYENTGMFEINGTNLATYELFAENL